VILLGSSACGEAGIAAAGRLAAVGVRVLTDTFTARQSRGEGRFRPDKMMYFGEQALKDLDGVDLIVLAGPASRWPSSPIPTGPACWCPKAARSGDPVRSRGRRAGRAERPGRRGGRARPRRGRSLCPARRARRQVRRLGHGGLDRAAHAGGRVISDDAVTAGLPIFTQTRNARAHDWLS
jgi:acetolactate synthase-1/2/3 large subunit